jgi:hypothetical protein
VKFMERNSRDRPGGLSYLGFDARDDSSLAIRTASEEGCGSSAEAAFR